MDEYLDINNKVLKWAGMWMPVSQVKPSERIFYYIYDLIIFSYTGVFYPLCEYMKFQESLSDLTGFMDYIKMVTTHTWGTVKLVVWHYKRPQIFKLLDTLRNNEQQDLSENDELNKSWKQAVLVNKLRTITITSCAVGISVAGSAGAVITLIFNADTLREGNDGNVTNSTGKMIANILPYHSWIPFEYQHSRFKYLLAILFQWHATFQPGFIIAGFDMYYVGILSYIALQFRVVQESFMSIRKKSLKKLAINTPYLENDCKLLRKQMHHEMREVTRRVQVLIKSCHDMEEMFTYIILGQTLFSLGTMCLCLFMVTTLPVLSMQFLPELLYFTAVTAELFVFSYYGSEVTSGAQDVANALFYSDWYTSDISYKRNIMINMVKLQKPIYFTIGKFQPISLSTFVSISKAAYSFCAVVKSME